MSFTEQEARARIQAIRGKQDVDVALVVHRGQIYYSFSPRPSSSPLISATVKLIQGLFDQHRDLSFFILRNRIFTTENLGPMIRGMVKLTAKRISQVDPSQVSAQTLEPDRELRLEQIPEQSFEQIEVGSLSENFFPVQALLAEPEVRLPTRFADQSEIVAALEMLRDAVPRGAVLHDHNRAISALMTDEGGELLSFSVNSASLNKTLHAEVRMLQKFSRPDGKKIPTGARIYVSLKPCQMCAGMLFEACENIETNEFYFLDNDEGPRAQRTALEGRIQKIR